MSGEQGQTMFTKGQAVAVVDAHDVAMFVSRVAAVGKTCVRIADKGIGCRRGGLSWGLAGEEGDTHGGRGFEAYGGAELLKLRPERAGDVLEAEAYGIAVELSRRDLAAWRAMPLAALREIAALVRLRHAPVAEQLTMPASAPDATEAP